MTAVMVGDWDSSGNELGEMMITLRACSRVGF